MKRGKLVARVLDLILVGTFSLLIISVANFTMATNKYFDQMNSNDQGSITITLLDSGCADCEVLGQLVDLIKSENVTVKTETTEELGSLNSRSYVDKYSIKKLPAIIIEGDTDKLSSGLLQIFEERGDALVFETPVGLHFDVATETVTGKVNVTYLTDSSCDGCYDVTIHDNALANVGLFVSDRKTYDISSPEGEALVEKYSITKVPTIILTGDLKTYQGFDQIWQSVGTVESDGTYVFRNMTQIPGANYTEIK